MLAPKSLLQFVRSVTPMLVLALAALLIACVPYQVIKQSSPSALAGAASMSVNFDYSQVGISDKRLTEQQWLDTREKEEHRTTYLETKESANTGVSETLAKKLSLPVSVGEAQPGGIQVTVIYTGWEEGMYAAVVAWPSKITATVRFSKDGVVTDEITMHVEEAASLYTPAPQQRLHTCGKRIGEYIAHYVVETTK